MRSETTRARLIGALLLAAMLAYASGSMLAATGAAGKPTLLTIGVLLMLVNSACVIALGALLFRVARDRGPGAARGYLGARVLEAVLLGAGALTFLMLPAGAAEGLSSERFNNVCYQLAMLALGLGSLPLFALLYRERLLLPRVLVGWGWVGYALLALGALLELFGVSVGLILAGPGGLFELAAAIWLLVRGARRDG